MKNRVYILLLGICMVWTGCRTDAEDIIPSQDEEVSTDNSAQTRESIKGFYLLNEGNMGSNKCTLDFYDATTGIYTRNIYAEVNPSVVKELGDVGNDLQVYDGKLWAVVNCSHFVEVMDAGTAEHITQISIPNCRYICFDGEYAYVSSYAGPVQIDPNARLGYVAKIDIKSLQVVDTCTVGYQPTKQHIMVGNTSGHLI